MKEFKSILKEIWLGIKLSNNFQNNHQRWPKI
jgi:hypothetical protein